MSDVMQFDLVSPEASLASTEVISVEIPGAEGDFTAMPQHAPLITSLRPGFLKINSKTETKEYIVSGGFVEINAVSTSVLAEKAFEKSNVTKAIVETLVDDAEKALESCGEGTKDAAAKRLSDTKLIGELLNF